MIANVPDFWSILIKLLQSFDNNNILHNEIYKIFESVLKEPEQNRSALQELLLNDENVLLKFIVFEAENDKKAKSSEKYTRRRGFIAHVINLCKLIEELGSNTLINQRIRKGKFCINWSCWIPRSDEDIGGKWHHWDKQEFGRVPDEKEPSTGHNVPKVRYFERIRIIPESLPKARLWARITCRRPARTSCIGIALTK